MLINSLGNLVRAGQGWLTTAPQGLRRGREELRGQWVQRGPLVGLGQWT